MLRAIALDDEPPALELLQRYAGQVSFLQLSGLYHRPGEALAALQREEPDLLFLDIQMPDLLGTELARLLRERPNGPMIIFTTAYPDYALEGFELQALDYLLKPFPFARFLKACQLALERLQERRPPGGKDFLFVKEGYDWVRVDLKEILFIRSDTNLLFIQERDRRIITRMTLAEILRQLPPERFLRTHKSYIVHLPAVDRLERHQVWVGGQAIPLAASYRGEVEKRLV